MDNSILDNEMNVKDLGLTGEAISFLQETAKWAKFLAIVGFVFLGIMIIAGFGMGSYLAASSSGLDNLGMSPIVFTLIYVGLAAIYFFPTLYLYRFATKTQNAIKLYSSGELAEGFGNLKSTFKFMGIFMIVFLGFYALMILFGIGAALFA